MAMASNDTVEGTMTEEHKDVLSRKLVDLQDNLRLTSIFWGILISSLVLTFGEVQTIQGTGRSDEDQVFDLVRILRRKNDDCFFRFLQALRQTNQAHLVVLLEDTQVPSSTPPALTRNPAEDETSAPDVKDIQLTIRDSLLRRCSEVETWTWAADKCYVPINKIFTDLLWVRSGGHAFGSASKEKLGHYMDMFKGSGERAAGFVFLQGVAGSGKSTLVQKLAVNWCEHIQRRWFEKSSQVSKSENVFSKFKYVLLVFLRYVKKAMYLQDIIQQQYCIEPGTASLLHKKMLKFPRDTLIILEGYDEYLESTSSDITDIAHRKIFKEATLVITSRHSPSYHFPDEEDRAYLPDNHVLVKGFSLEGVFRYIHNYFEETDPSKSDPLLASIRESEELSELSRFPAILLLMCTLWAHEASLPKTISAFFLEFVTYVCGRYESKYVTPKNRAKPGNIIKKYDSWLLKIGKVSVSGLRKQNLQLTFLYKDVIKKIGEKAWLLGFLKRESNMDGGEMVAFPHKTMQEFFAAYFIVYSNRRKRHNMLVKFYNSDSVIVESEMIHTFVNGLGGEAIMEEINKLIQGSGGDIAKVIPALQLSSQAQNMTIRLKLPSRVHLEITEKYREAVYKQYLLGDCARVLHLTVRAAGFHAVTDRAVLPALGKMTRLKELKFGGWSLTVSGLGSLCQILSMQKPPLTELDMENAVRRDVHGVFWPTLMDSFPVTLEILKVSYNDITNESVWHLSQRVPLLKQLQVVRMAGCNLYDQDAVLELIKNSAGCPTLSKIDVEGNILGDGLGHIVHLTQHMISLRELDLGYNSLSRQVKAGISQKLSKDLPQLKLRL